VAIAARRLRIPYTVALVAAGIALGALHVFEPPHLTQQLLFSVILPGLLFEAAFHIEFRDFWRDSAPILGLAIPGVALAIALTTWILTAASGSIDAVRDFDWRHALVFGALIAATDPIAVVGLFRSLGAPRRLTMLVEGESLLNDGTAIVFFSLALELVRGQTVTAGGLAVDFVTIVGTGLLVGSAVGVAISQIIRNVDDPMIEITLTTLAAYGTFVAAEQLHSSGVIATVTAGMLCGNYGARTGMSPSTRIAAETFWDYVAFALNSIVFLLIGFEVHVRDLLASWPAILLAYGVVTAGRAAVIFAGTALLGLSRERLPLRWSAVLAWGGLRGALSMVLALSLPRDFPNRDVIVTMTFGVVILSIGIQGLTMSRLLRWLGIVRQQETRAAYELGRGRLQSANAALQELERMQRARLLPPRVLEAVREDYEQRVQSIEEKVEELRQSGERLEEEEFYRARRHLLQIEKEHAIDLYRRGVLGHESYEKLLADIDARLLELESGGGPEDVEEREREEASERG